MKKKLLSIILAAIMVITFIPVMTFAEVTGTGTTSDPWLIGKDTPSDVTATLDSGVLAICGTGPMMDFSYDAPWSNKSSTINSITIEPNVTRIGDSAFYGCTKLETVTFASGSQLKTIGKDVFEECICLPAITIPASVETIGSAFYDCKALMTITVEEGNTNFVVEDGVLFNKDKTTLIQYPAGKTGRYTIPASVTTICDYAFSACRLTSIEIPATVKNFGRYIFGESSSLATVNILEGVETIGPAMFYRCSALENIEIPVSLKNFGDNAFQGCSALKTVTIANDASFTRLGYAAFDGCTSLTTINIPINVTYIGYYAFENTKLTSITIPEKVTGIDVQAFFHCSELTNVTVKATTPPVLVASAFEKCDKLEKIYVPAESVEAYKEANGWSNYADRIVHRHGAFTQWDTADSLPTTAGSYYLTTDVTLSETWTVPVATATNLCLSGHVINFTSDKGSVIKVDDGATLNLYDCNSDGQTHYYEYSSTAAWKYIASPTDIQIASAVAIEAITDTTEIVAISGGVITGGNMDDNGGGVYVDEGTFTMNGGNIVGNTAGEKGGAVYVRNTSSNKFTMNGGSIIGNTAKYGGGVYISNGIFTMTGGDILENIANKGAGGVYYDGGTVTLGGSAKITSNFKGTGDNAIASNLYLNGGYTIDLCTGDNVPKDGMKIGVTMSRPGKFSTNGEASNTQYFDSDDTTYEVQYDKAGYLRLHKHKLVKVYGKAAAVQVSGWKDYYECKDIDDACQKYFEDENGTTPIENLEVWKALGGNGYIAPLTPPAPVYYGGGDDSTTVTVPVSSDENSVKISATVSGSTATVNKISDADLAKVIAGESVTIDLSTAGKNVDTAKIPTETVEKIAEKSAMTVKLPVATVEFDKTATEEIVGQAKGSNIELVVDDIKTVSLNAVQKETVGKLDTALIIDAHLASNGSRLCTENNGGFGGGRAKVILPYEIKNNRTAANYSVYYVNETGNRQRLVSVYDEELKAFVFEIEHFSIYALAYDEYAMPFVDVAENRFFYEPIKWAAKNQITDGIDATHFDPFGVTNRAQMVTFLWRAAGSPEPTITKTSFKDLDSKRYYYKAVLWAYENGITDGTTATTFEPNLKVSRAQVVTFLWRYAEKPVVNYFIQMTDVESSRYYTEAARWALSEKITDGTTSTTFSPNDDCLRGQIVTFLYRSFVK